MRGIKISKPGFDVKTAADNELLFNSEYPQLKIHKQGSGEITISPGSPIATNYVDITHDTGVVAMYWVMSEIVDSGFNIQDKYTKLPYSIYVGLGEYVYMKPLMDTTKLRLQYDLTSLLGSDLTLKYFYFIFEDPIVE